MSEASVTVVVCTRNRPEKLARCLASLASLDHPNFEVVVVDNGPADDSTRTVADRFHARTVVQVTEGLSRSRNAGALAARGDLVAFIDDDAIADPGWLAEHVAAIDDPAIGGTTGRVLPLDPAAPGAGIYADLGPEPFRVERGTDAWFQRSNFGGIGLGGNMVFRRSLFTEGWRFHVGLGLGAPIRGGDEHYAFFSLLRDGYAIGYVPDALVRHEGPTTAAEFESRRKQIQEADTAYLVMLLFDESGFRRDAFRYAVEGLRGNPRPWREGIERLGTRRDRIGSTFRGALSYLRHRRLIRRGRPRAEALLKGRSRRRPKPEAEDLPSRPNGHVNLP